MTRKPTGARSEADFARRLAEAEGFVTEHPDLLVLLGPQPTEPETERGRFELCPGPGRLPGAGPRRRPRR